MYAKSFRAPRYSKRRHEARDEHKPKPCSCSNKSAEAGNRLADDQRVHLSRPFVRINCLGSRDEAADMVLQENAVAAKQFAGVANRLTAFDGTKSLGQRRMLVAHLALVLQLRETQHHGLGRRHITE